LILFKILLTTPSSSVNKEKRIWIGFIKRFVI
jgi:hypothetical protein